MKRIFAFLLTAIMILTLASCSQGEEGAPEGMKSVNTDSLNFKMYIPTEWTADIESAMISARVSEYKSANLSVMWFSDTTTTDHKEFFKKYKEQLPDLFEAYELTAEGTDSVLDNNPAGIYEYKVSSNGKEYKISQLICYKDSSFFVITFTAESAEFDSYKNDLDRIITNFSFK